MKIKMNRKNSIYLTLALVWITFGLISLLTFTSAFPLQLLPNGSIVDLGNTTINGTPVDFIFENNTLFIIPKAASVNITNLTNIITNLTNITIQNITGNYTYENITLINNTYIFNGTENFTNFFTNFTYNKEELDKKFADLTINPDMSPYVLKSEAFAVFNSSMNWSSIIEENTDTNNTWIWIAIVILALSIAAMFIFFMSSQ